MNYKISLAAQQALVRIDGILAELDRQTTVDKKLIADLEQAIQARLEARAIIQEYAGTIRANGLR